MSQVTTTKTDLTRAQTRTRRALDAERRELAARVVASIERHGSGREPFDPLAYALTMREVDEIMAIWYGRWPGDETARFWRLILDQCRVARRLAFQRAVQDIRRRLRGDRALLRAIEAEAV